MIGLFSDLYTDARLSELDMVIKSAAYGSMGGKARAAKLSPERRREIAVNAVCSRWYGNYERHACPRCGGRNTHANGTVRGGQKWRCRDCMRQWI